MAKEEGIVVDWIVTDILWGWFYWVDITELWLKVRAKVAGKMKMYKIKLIPWDSVKVELSEYDPQQWRIVYRNAPTRKWGSRSWNKNPRRPGPNRR